MNRECPSCKSNEYYYIQDIQTQTTYEILKEEGNLVTVESNPTASPGKEKTISTNFFECKICKKRWPALHGIVFKQENLMI